MANTPYMNLLLPLPSITVGPTWASELNTALTSIDSHNHSPGNGALIPSIGIGINADLTMAGFNLTNCRTVKLKQDTVNPPSTFFDRISLYTDGVELVYIDGVGNAVPITSGGALSATSLGGITGLAAPAAVTYNAAAKMYTFSANTGTVVPGAIDIGSATIRQVNTGSPHGITVQSPNTLAADYSLTLLTALPASTNPLFCDASGNLTAPTNVVFPGTMNVVGNFNVNTNKFSVTAASGATLVAGALTAAAGLTTRSGTLPGTVGDIVCARAGGTTGFIFFESTLAHYFGFDGTSFQLGGSAQLQGLAEPTISSAAATKNYADYAAGDLCAAFCSSTGLILNKKGVLSGGSFALASHPSTGIYNFTVPGLTTNAIVTGNAYNVANASVTFICTSGNLEVFVEFGTGTTVDTAFSFVIKAL